MNEDKGVLKTTEEQQCEKAGGEDEISTSLPYYWSWYRLVFPEHAQGPGDIRLPLQPENR